MCGYLESRLVCKVITINRNILHLYFKGQTLHASTNTNANHIYRVMRRSHGAKHCFRLISNSAKTKKKKANYYPQ